MTVVVPHRLPAMDPLASITSALQAVFGADLPLRLAPGLLVADDTGWISVERLIDGSRLDEFVELALRRWRGTPHAATALSWKTYTFWLALPATLGWAACRRVPLLYPADVLVRLDGRQRPVRIGLRRSVTVAVLPTDPLAEHRPPHVRVVPDLLVALRESLLDAHLLPLIEAMQRRVRVGDRNLLGSVSSGIAAGILRSAHTLPGPPGAHISTLLDALGLADLIELVPGPSGQPTVRRKTCCLRFTLPESKICAGCCIRA